MKYTYIVLTVIFFVFNGCEIFNSDSSTRDYIITVNSKKDLPIDSIKALTIKGADSTHWFFTDANFEKTTIDSITERITVTLDLKAHKNETIVVEYSCYSSGLSIVQRNSRFKMNAPIIQISGGVDTVLVSFLQEYNKKHTSLDSTTMNPLQREAQWDQNKTILRELTTVYMLEHDSSSLTLYDAYKKHTVHKNSSVLATADTIALFSTIRDTLIIRGLNVDSVFATILPDNLNADSLLASLPEPSDIIKRGEPEATFTFSGTIGKHNQDVSKVVLHIWGTTIADTIITPASYDPSLGTYLGLLDVYEIGDNYTVAVHVYDYSSRMTGYIRKDFNRLQFAISFIDIDAWNAKPWASIDPLIDVSINDTIAVSWNGGDSLNRGTIAEAWWKSGDSDYIQQIDSVHSIVAPPIMSLDYAILLKVMDNDSNVTYDTISLNVLQDAPIIDAGEAIEVPVNLPIKFKGSASQEFGFFTLFKWDFVGDGLYNDSASIDTIHEYTYQHAGVYTARYSVIDDDYNTQIDSLQVTVTNSAPEVYSLSVDTVVLLKDTIVSIYDTLFFTAQVKDAESNICNVTLNGNGNTKIDVSDTVNFTADSIIRLAHAYSDTGTFTAEYTVIDYDGLSHTAHVKVGVVQDVPKVLAGTSFTQAINSMCTFDATVTQKFGSYEMFIWDFNGDGIMDDSSAITPDIEYIYRKSGSYTAKLFVRDDDKNIGIDSLSVIITNTPPIIDQFKNDTLVAKGSIVSFTAETHDIDGTIDLYEWDMDGDGVYEVSESVYKAQLKQFTIPGTYMIRLKVKDDDGKIALDSCKFQVNHPPTILTTQLVMNENSLALIGPIIAEDADGDTFDLSIEGTTFTLDEGYVLHPQISLDYEKDSIVELVVVLSDQIDTIKETIAIKIVNLNDNIPNIIFSKEVLNVGEDTETLISIKAQDADNDSLVWTHIIPNNGSVTIVSTARSSIDLSYTPNKDYIGTDLFKLITTDGVHYDTTTINIDVGGIDDPAEYTGTPILSGDNVVTGILIVTPGECHDIDSEEIFTYQWYRSLTALDPGTVIPGVVSNSYQLTESDGARFINVIASCNGIEKTTDFTNEINSPPIIRQNDIYNIFLTEDSDRVFGISATDVNGTPLTWSIIDPVSNATVTFSKINNDTIDIRYTNKNNFTGTDEFKVKVTDGTLFDEITIIATISEVNDSPVIAPPGQTSFTLIEDMNTTQLSTLSASDEEGDPLIWAIQKQGVLGEMVVTQSGVVSYTPIGDAFGEDSIIIQVSDSHSTDVVVLSITIQGVNDVPVITPIASTDFEINEDSRESKLITLESHDPDKELLIWSITRSPQYGTGSVSSTGDVFYTPNPDAAGADTMRIEVRDTHGAQDNIVLAIEVLPLNDSPIITPPDQTEYTLTEDDTAVRLVTIIATDKDSEGLVWRASNNTTLGVVTVVSGQVTYSPKPNSHGRDNVNIIVDDGKSTDQVPLIVDILSVDDEPIITLPATTKFSIDEDAAVTQLVTLSATDGDGDVLEWRITTNGNNGIAAISTGGMVSYTPTPEAFGTDLIIIQVSDGRYTDDISLNITINSINDAPVIETPTETEFTLLEDADLVQLTTLFAIDKERDDLSWSISQNGTTGVASVSSDGIVSYKANNNMYGVDNIRVRVSDQNASAEIGLRITVQGVNDAPVISPPAQTSFLVGENSESADLILLNAVDYDDDALVWSVIQNGSHGTASIDTLGQVIYAPNTMTNGVDILRIQVSDSRVTDEISLTVTVNSENDTPIIDHPAQVIFTFIEDAVEADLTTLSATDEEKDNLIWSVFKHGGNGSAAVTDGGLVSYIPNENFYGKDTFKIAVSDNYTEDVISLFIVVTPTNDAPTFDESNETSFSRSEDDGTMHLVTLLATDVDEDNLTWSIIQNGIEGHATISDGSIFYTPKDNIFGDDALIIRVSDNIEYDDITLNISIQSVNDEPLIFDSAIQGTVLNGSLLSNPATCTDLEDGTITPTISWYRSDNQQHVDDVFIVNALEYTLTDDDLANYIFSIATCEDKDNGIATATTEYTNIVRNPGKLTLVFDTQVGSAGLTVAVPLKGSVDVLIDWGDGNTQVITQESNVVHEYSTHGTYTVTIEGSLEWFGKRSWDNSTLVTNNLIKVTSFGDLGIQSLSGAFVRAENLIELPQELPSTIIDLTYMLYYATSFNFNINSWDVSNVVNISGLFAYATSFNQPLNDWDTKSVTSMADLFLKASQFNKPLDKWDMSNVTDMKYAFRFATAFNQNINTWDVSKVRSFKMVFNAATSFDSPLYNWKTGSATDFAGVFEYATSFNQPIDDWDVSKATDMSSAFEGAGAFSQNLNDWDVSNVRLMDDMFRDASSFNSPLEKWDVRKLTSMILMFYRAATFDQPLDDWDIMSLTTGEGFVSCSYAYSDINYSKNLVKWAELSLQSGVTLDFTNCKYDTGAALARQKIIDDFGWTLKDGGLIP